MKLSDDFIKGTIDKAMQENEEEPRPETRIKKKPGPKPGFKKKKEEASHQPIGVPEQKSVPPMPEVKTPDENMQKKCDKTTESVQETAKSVNNTSENVSKPVESVSSDRAKDPGICLPMQSKALVMKQLKDDLIIIDKEVSELLDRKIAIQNFLKAWE